MFGATSIGPYLGSLVIFLITLRSAGATTAYDCNTKILNVTTKPFEELGHHPEDLQKIKQFAAENPNDFAYLYMNHPGYTTIIKEDNFNILECKPVFVDLPLQDECYDQLAIVMGEKKLFMNPWTLIISTDAEKISCDAPTLVRYELEGIWYKVVPKPVSPLNKEKPKSKYVDDSSIRLIRDVDSWTWKYKSPGNLMTAGIYSQNDLNRAWESQRYPERMNLEPAIHISHLEVDGNAATLKGNQLDGITQIVDSKPVSPLKDGKPESKDTWTWKYEDPGNLMSSGIYSEGIVKNRVQQLTPMQTIYSSSVSRYPDADANAPGVIYPNKDEIPWYKDLKVYDVMVVAAPVFIVIILLMLIVKMVADRINHGSAFHSIKECRRRRTRSNQPDFTVRLKNTQSV